MARAFPPARCVLHFGCALPEDGMPQVMLKLVLLLQGCKVKEKQDGEVQTGAVEIKTVKANGPSKVHDVAYLLLTPRCARKIVDMLLEQVGLSQDVDILDDLLNDGSEAIEQFRTLMYSLWMNGRCSLNEFNFAAHNLHRVSCILGVHLHCYGYSVQVGRPILVWMIVCRGAGVQSSQNSVPSFTRIKLKQNSYRIYECSLCCYVIQSMMPTMPVPTTTNARCIKQNPVSPAGPARCAEYGLGGYFGQRNLQHPDYLRTGRRGSK